MPLEPGFHSEHPIPSPGRGGESAQTLRLDVHAKGWLELTNPSSQRTSQDEALRETAYPVGSGRRALWTHARESPGDRPKLELPDRAGFSFPYKPRRQAHSGAM